MSGGKDYLGIILSEEYIAMAHMKGQASGLELQAVAKRDLRGIPEDDWPKTIDAAMGDIKVNVRNAVPLCILPSNVVTIKNIEIPSTDPGEIKSIIDLQAGRHTPYAREEIIIDYLNIGVYNRNYSKVLLIIVNRNVLNKQIAVLERAGLKVNKVLFVPEGLARFYASALNLAKEPAPVGIIDVGESFTEFTIEFNGTVIACRNIPVGLKNLTLEAKPAYDRLVAELKKSVESYQGEDIEKVPDNYILTITDDRVKELQRPLQEALGVNVKTVNYLDHLKLKPQAQKFLSENPDDSFLSIVAGLTTASELKLDLLPEDVKMQRALERQGHEVAKSGIFIFILVILFCSIFFIKLYFKSASLNNIKKANEPKRKEAQLLEEVTARTGLVKDYFKRRLGSLNVLNELFNLIPEEIYLENVTLESDGKIIIQGISESMSQVFTLVGVLEDSALFKGVKTTSTTAKKERGKDVAAFEITFRLESAQDEEEPAKDTKKAKGDKKNGGAKEDKKSENGKEAKDKS